MTADVPEPGRDFHETINEAEGDVPDEEATLRRRELSVAHVEFQADAGLLTDAEVGRLRSALGPSAPEANRHPGCTCPNTGDAPAMHHEYCAAHYDGQRHYDCVPREPEQERYDNALDSLADTAQRLYRAEERADRAEVMLDRCDEAREQVIAERDRLRNDNRKLATRDPDVRTVMAYEAGRDDEREQAEADNRRLREALEDALFWVPAGYREVRRRARAALDGGEQ